MDISAFQLKTLTSEMTRSIRNRKHEATGPESLLNLRLLESVSNV